MSSASRCARMRGRWRADSERMGTQPNARGRAGIGAGIVSGPVRSVACGCCGISDEVSPMTVSQCLPERLYTDSLGPAGGDAALQHAFSGVRTAFRRASCRAEQPFQGGQSSPVHLPALAHYEISRICAILMGFPFCGGVNAADKAARPDFPGDRRCRVRFRFERLPFMSSAENHQSRPGAFGQPLSISKREHS